MLDVKRFCQGFHRSPKTSGVPFPEGRKSQAQQFFIRVSSDKFMGVANDDFRQPHLLHREKQSQLETLILVTQTRSFAPQVFRVLVHSQM